MEAQHLIFGLALALLTYILFDWTRPKAGGIQEPPSIRSKIPIIGHVVGILRHGTLYFGRASDGTKEPIFTLNFLVSKIYVVKSSSLVSAIQRNSRTITFDPFIDSSADRMAGVHGKGLKLLQGKESGGGDLNRKIVKSMHPSLLGPGLDIMNQNMISNLSKSVDELASFGNNSFDFYGWARHAISVASADAVWGEHNPLKSKEVEDAFWDFESYMALLPMKVFPSITARKSYLGREKLVAAFIKYYNEGGQHAASDLAKARWSVQHESGADVEDIARMEAATVVGVLSNTSPSSFWMIFDVYSRPSLLAQLRDEVRENALRFDESNKCYTIDLASMRDNCPNLLATYQEVLRFRSNSSPTRFVTDDVLLNDKYLLKKGRLLILPSHNMNFEPSIWGEDSKEFNPSRFKKETLKQRPTSFMAFGASPSLCPGRHFASGEILGMAAMMILRYDITPVSGKWVIPKFQKGALAASMPAPGEAFNVTVSAREEFAGGRWDFSVTEGKGKFALITG